MPEADFSNDLRQELVREFDSAFRAEVIDEIVERLRRKGWRIEPDPGDAA